jgi:hypothetical protein
MPLLTDLDVVFGVSNYKDAAPLALAERDCVPQRGIGRSGWMAWGEATEEPAITPAPPKINCNVGLCPSLVAVREDRR